jgi:NAD(P)-dependent dehydrogenase (short-subunit alcohol dehydrogenase family)
MGLLNGKTVVVTGGNTGIGKEICLGFGAEGANVVVNWIFNEEAALEVCELVKNLGGNAEAVYGDVTSLVESKKVRILLQWFLHFRKQRLQGL